MNLIPDAELVKKALAGDVESFASLVRSYSNAVFTAAFQYVKDYHHAQDIAQEAFVRAWRNRMRIQDPEKFGKWLYTTTKRISIDWIRKSGKLGQWSELDRAEIPANQTTEDQAIQNERKAMLRDALHRLSENDRTVILLYYMSGLNTREISRFLGVSVNTVESRLRRTREKLKGELFVMVGDVLKEEKGSRGEGKTIHLSYALGSFYIDLFNEHVVKRFEQANPNIKVKVTAYDLCELPNFTFEEELIKMAAKGTLPDVALFDPAHIPSWAERGLLHSLTDDVKEDRIRFERFYESAWDSCGYMGEVFGLPWNMSNAALFYNKALMREAGLDPERPPATIRELDRMAELMFKKDGNGEYTQAGFIPWFSAGSLFLNSLIWGGEWSRDGKLTPSDRNIIESLSWMKSYADRYDRGKLEAFLHSVCQERNPYERFGFVFLGCWDMYSIYPRYVHADDDWGIAPLPTKDGITRTTSLGGFSFVVPKGAAHPKEAWEFMKYAAYDERLKLWVKADPESNHAAMPEANRTHPLAGEPKFQVFLDAISYGVRKPQSPLFPDMWLELQRITEAVVSGIGNPQELLEQLQARLDGRSQPTPGWIRAANCRPLRS
ncbi:extracellular solute-binding protein [Paenibacillus thermotolerans]|uniref:extracellular solute-binding protein n=1 Tax=Paenibacillus thermotolerans TaxID=3027807 RepID=UPI00236760B7|nr:MULTISPECIES: extracellular solute-binding protein [unclassified Paenibacillus]